MSAARATGVPTARTAPRTSRTDAHGLWYWYCNAREWGKPVVWSLRYAREARRQFS
jgi:hypothetical protein